MAAVNTAVRIYRSPLCVSATLATNWFPMAKTVLVSLLMKGVQDYNRVLSSDTDECEQSSHDCDQICTNTLGSYECSCETDFTLGDDSRTCVPSCTATYTALSGSFQSPGWPAYYPQLDFSCRWTIDLEEADYGIRFSVDSSVYGILGAPPCHTDYLQFYDGLTSDAVSLGRFCHLTIPREIVTTTGRALVVFKSSSMTRPLSRKGARITYEAYRLGRHSSIIVSLVYCPQ